MYVDDLMITGNNEKDIQKLKEQLNVHFYIKDLDELRYFLGLEVAKSSQGIFVSQKKYAFDLLKETWMNKCQVRKLLID